VHSRSLISQDASRDRLAIEVLHDDRRVVIVDDRRHRNACPGCRSEQCRLAPHGAGPRRPVGVAAQHQRPAVECERPRLSRRAAEHPGQVADLTTQPRPERFL
jgi:hypothetical protein